MIEPQVGEIVGFRLFLMSEDGVLSSYAAAYGWEPGINEATCPAFKRAGHGPVPAVHCKCGFWMYRDLVSSAWMFRGELAGIWNPLANPFGRFESLQVAVLGQCRGWGRVTVGESGWRTQFAAIDALFDIGNGTDLGVAASRYDVLAVQAELDLSLVRTGRLTRFGDTVDVRGRVEVEIDGSPLLVRNETDVFFELWAVPLGW